MKLWVVNHPYPYRRWLKVETRLLGKDEWCHGYIWSEWFGDHDAGNFHVPRLPPTEITTTNVDPLVIGQHMYFDYCRKGANGRNDRQRNELSRGDLVLFGCVNQGDLIIDTIFAIGATRPWSARGIPNWSNLDALARRVHFHDVAHNVQHAEVHSMNPLPARSYRGESNDADLFCWVPCLIEAPSATRPLILAESSNAYRLLSQAYDGVGLEDAMKGSFGVVDLADGLPLFKAILDEARLQGFAAALEMRLLSEVAHDASYQGKASCGPSQGASTGGRGEPNGTC